jgi:ATP-dependent Clp protease ATP-binding subunit ClpA
MKQFPSLSPVSPATLIQFPARLRQRIRGQDEAVDRVVDVVQRRETGVVPQRGPRGSMIFAGPTGVGKTLLAATVAEVLFGSGKLECFDCSEFKSLDKYDELFGNREGDAGRFGQAHARVLEGVWLFDELEKAHPQFVHLFLQAADAARLTLANGQILSLSGIYLVVTTNIGSATIAGRDNLPFASIENHVCRAIEKWLRPELLGRFGRPYVFRPLGREAQEQITKDRVSEIVEWNRAQGREIHVNPDVLSFLICRGFSQRLGARLLQQAIEELVGNAIKNDLLNGGSGSGALVVCGDQLKLVR